MSNDRSNEGPQELVQRFAQVIERRDLMTAVSGVANAQTPTADNINTRKASCNCGKLTATTKGPDPERRSVCFCKYCQMRTGSAFSIQARYPRSQVTIEGKSTAWKFPIAGAKPVAYRSCDSEGVTYHFCPECGSNVYYVFDDLPDIVWKVGAFTDPTFPPPGRSDPLCNCSILLVLICCGVWLADRI